MRNQARPRWAKSAQRSSFAKRPHRTIEHGANAGVTVSSKEKLVARAGKSMSDRYAYDPAIGGVRRAGGKR